MVRVPWWAVVSSGLAPVFLIGGWTLAAALQRDGYSSVRDTISGLAGFGATDRWVMTAGLYGLGACHVVTALALRTAAPAGRVLLAVGGLATIAVAAFPLPTVGTSNPHRIAAGIAFGALAIWPALAVRDRPDAPWGLRLWVGLVAATVLLGLIGWFVAELAAGGPRIGLTERFVAGAQALWPLVVVLTAVIGPGAAGRGGGTA
jgi:hypothetical membrane protein